MLSNSLHLDFGTFTRAGYFFSFSIAFTVFDQKQTIFHENFKIDWFIYKWFDFIAIFYVSNVCVFCVNIWTLVFHTNQIHSHAEYGD